MSEWTEESGNHSFADKQRRKAGKTRREREERT
jgi:hypothetical protein